ncbi:MAG: tripartite tricarboxylate transporter substrate binding protein [Burkholderiales bacterium]|nr:tripartite tricarboxylate transporter substrate binding protein [Burkholderiales bacterium]
MTNIARLLLLATALGLAPAAFAQAWPAKPVKLIIPFPPGGASDYVGRTIGQVLSDAWGQPVVIENRGGAGATVGTSTVAKAPPDGYTLLMGVNAGIVIAPHVYPQLNYDPLKELVPAAGFAVSPMVMVVPADSPVKTVAEFIAMARARPGTVSFASSGSGALPHLTTEKFRLAAKLEMLHVPYKGSGPALVDLLAGRTQMMIDIIVSALPHVQSGKLRALAVTTARRDAALPAVPTMIEAGLAGFTAEQWYAIFAPAGTAPAVLARIQADLARAMQAAELRDNFSKRGADAAFVEGTRFAETVRRDSAQWAEIVRITGARAD